MCMCVYLYRYMYMCVYVYVYLCVCVYVYVCLCVCVVCVMRVLGGLCYKARVGTGAPFRGTCPLGLGQLGMRRWSFKLIDERGWGATIRWAEVIGFVV